MIWTVDRIEGDYALCENENREVRPVPLADLPAGTESGSVFREEGGRFVPDEAAREARRRRLAELQARIFGKDAPDP